MYHRVDADKLSNSRAILEKHFEYIKEHFHVVLPGEVLAKDLINICILFDDASYSFYCYVLPLIQRFGIRVVLAVPPKFIVDSGDHVPPSVRLSVPTNELMQGDVHIKAAPFCSWPELSEISASGFVKIASHSFSHPNLLQCPNVEDELLKSKKILEEKLHQDVDTFVYPYGQFNAPIVKQVQAHYKYNFAVGAGDNKTWEGVGGVLFRMFADNLSDPISIFSQANLKKYEFMRIRLYVKKWFMDHKPSR
ncbi:MAG: polysaccharide deacetylase family protein [Bacteroidota bacterium]